MTEGKEIERKFLLWENGQNHTTPEFKELGYPDPLKLKNHVIQNGDEIIQGYIPDMKTALAVARGLQMKIPDDFEPVEARFRKRKGIYTFCIKGEGDIERDEFEKKATERFYIRNSVLVIDHKLYKTRLTVPYLNRQVDPHKKHQVDVDIYKDMDLITAEVEFDTLEEAREFTPFGLDVSGELRYKGRTLAGIV